MHFHSFFDSLQLIRVEIFDLSGILFNNIPHRAHIALSVFKGGLVELSMFTQLMKKTVFLNRFREVAIVLKIS